MLPPLPKKNKKTEANFGLAFVEFIKNKKPQESYQYELKDTRGKDSFYLKELSEKQVNHALRSKTKTGNLVRVISGTPGSPDYHHFVNCKYSFVVIRYPQFFAFIDIDDLLNEGGKYLNYKRAQVIATFLSTD